MATPDYPTTETIARIMATGYNRHVSDHGPGGSYASETMESRDGHGVVVDRGGSQFAVRVERLPAMTTTVPKTPGQHWAGLRVKLTVDAATEQRLGDDYSEMSGDEAEASANQHWGSAKALREVLAGMDREEGQS